MKVKRRYRAAFIAAGPSLFLLTVVAATTSRFTPQLAKYPLALEMMGIVGFYTAVAVTAASIWWYADLRRRIYLAWALAGTASVAVVSFTDLGSALQLPLAGLLIGIPLIVFGCSPTPFIRNARS